VPNTLSDDDDGDHLCHASGCLLPPPSGPVRRRRRPVPAAGRVRRSIIARPWWYIYIHAAPANKSAELKPPLHAPSIIGQWRLARRRITRRARCHGSPESGMKGVRHCARRRPCMCAAQATGPFFRFLLSRATVKGKKRCPSLQIYRARPRLRICGACPCLWLSWIRIKSLSSCELLNFGIYAGRSMTSN